MDRTSIEKAVELVGGQKAMADAINKQFPPEADVNLKQSHVWKWLNTTQDGVSEKFVIPMSSATGWKVTPHELRPDIYPHPEDGLPEERRTKPRFAA